MFGTILEDWAEWLRTKDIGGLIEPPAATIAQKRGGWLRTPITPSTRE